MLPVLVTPFSCSQGWATGDDPVLWGNSQLSKVKHIKEDGRITTRAVAQFGFPVEVTLWKSIQKKQNEAGEGDEEGPKREEVEGKKKEVERVPSMLLQVCCVLVHSFLLQATKEKIEEEDQGGRKGQAKEVESVPSKPSRVWCALVCLCLCKVTEARNQIGGGELESVSCTGRYASLKFQKEEEAWKVLIFFGCMYVSYQVYAICVYVLFVSVLTMHSAYGEGLKCSR